MRHRREYNKALIGKNLKRARERQGLTVEDVREYLCLGSVQAIYKYEAGLSYPTADTLLALMELYHINRVDLLCRQLAQCIELEKCAHWSIDVQPSQRMQIQVDIGMSDDRSMSLTSADVRHQSAERLSSYVINSSNGHCKK